MRNTIIIAIIIVISLSGCRRSFWGTSGYVPGNAKGNFSSFILGKPAGLYEPPDDYPVEYKDGWYHGCESGFSAYGNTIHKVVYSFQQDIKMMKNVLYSKAWIDSFNYCRAYLNRTLIDGMWWGAGFASGEDLGALSGNQHLRDGLIVNKGSSFFGILDGIRSPWLGSGGEESSDWLGRSDADSRDWLGRKPADR